VVLWIVNNEALCVSTVEDVWVYVWVN